MLPRSLLLALLCLGHATVAVKLNDWAYPFGTTTPHRRRRLQNGAFQSPVDSQGSSFVSSVSFNKASQALHLVGSTYGSTYGTWSGGTSACFYSVLELDGESPVVSHQQVLGNEGVTQACHNVLVDEPKNRVYVAGHTTVGGVLQQFEDEWDFESITTVYGTLLDLNYDTSITNPAEVPRLAGGYVYQEGAVEYSLGVAKEADENRLYTVTMSLNPLPAKNSIPTTEDPTQTFEYSGFYTMVVSAYELNDAGADTSTLARTLGIRLWPTELVPDEFPLVDIAGIAKLGSNVFVAGTTAGHGKGFGRRNQPGADLDGFVSKLSAASGDIPAPDETILGAATDPATQAPDPYTWRAWSFTAANERIHGLCTSEQTQEYIYATGSTRGFVGDQSIVEAKKKAFIAKIRISDMSQVWVQHVGAKNLETEVEGISCTVSGDGSAIYFAGNVKNGVVEDSGIAAPYGESDVFIAKIDNAASPTEGQVIFVKQFGSAGDDTIARRGGLETIGVAGDKVVVVGNTKGGMYRDQSGTDNSSVFAVVVSQDGTFSMPTGTGSAPSPPAPPTPVAPTPAATPNPPAANPPPTPTPTSAPTYRDVQTGPILAPPKKEESSGGGSWRALLILLVLGIFFTVLAMCGHNYWYQKREATTDRSKVLDYLQHFDVEDVDLKHSATGGWHCSYVNDLSRGINVQTNPNGSYMDRGFMGDSNYHDATFDPLNSAGSSPNSPESKVLEDSLFVIEDGEEMLTFGNDRTERSGLGKQYSRKWTMNGKGKSRRKSNEWGREII